MYIGDMKKNTWFDSNQSENIREKNIIHQLTLKKWISDTQFTYVDVTRYFTSPIDPHPFISAKEVTYDIASRARFHEKAVTEDEVKKMG